MNIAADPRQPAEAPHAPDPAGSAVEVDLGSIGDPDPEVVIGRPARKPAHELQVPAVERPGQGVFLGDDPAFGQVDLVEVAPDARPPVCRVLDYSKYRYEQAQKQKAARKHQQQITVREIKFRPKIAQNDYDTKKSHVTRFLLGKDKVKITIMFRGREVTHPERGTALLDRLADELAEIAVIEQSPAQDGRNMTMLLAPSKSVLAAEKDGKPENEAANRRHS